MSALDAVIWLVGGVLWFLRGWGFKNQVRATKDMAERRELRLKLRSHCGADASRGTQVRMECVTLRDGFALEKWLVNIEHCHLVSV